MERRSPVIFTDPFSENGALATQTVCNCYSRLSNGWDSGPVIEHPLTALPPLRLPALLVRTAPIPRRHTAGTCEDRDILYSVGGGGEETER